MFGYVITNCKTLSDDQRARFRAMYCGMCHTLKTRYGNIGRFTLSYDMTFAAMVLSALYEADEQQGRERCLPHMVKPHDYILSPAMEYAVDINVALAYHKCMDNWQDDRNLFYAAAGKALSGAFRRVQELHPEQCRAIQDWMDGVRKLEQEGREEIDPFLNLTGNMLGSIFAYKKDFWSAELFRMGDALGRFIYFMDAYDDLEKDVKRGRFNPLKSMMHQPDYEEICKDAMTMILADCAEAFERLPIVRDADLIRNIIYSGVWSKYSYIQTKKAEKQAKIKGAK